MFLFVYIGQITFAALGSQGVPSSETKETRSDYYPDERNSPQGSGRSGAPPGHCAVVVGSCSPKSVYCQANKVRSVAFPDYVAADSSIA